MSARLQEHAVETLTDLKYCTPQDPCLQRFRRGVQTTDLSPASMDQRVCQAVSTLDGPMSLSTKTSTEGDFSPETCTVPSALPGCHYLLLCTSRTVQLGLEHIRKETDTICFPETPRLLEGIVSNSLTLV